MTGESNIDSTIASAWTAFRQDLASTLRELAPSESANLTINFSDEDATAPYLQFFKSGDGDLLLSEVSSNQVLTGHFRLSPDQIGELLRIGWAPPSAPSDELENPNFHLIDSEIERAVFRVQETLQSVFGIPHPHFLSPPPREDELHQAHLPPPDPHAHEAPLDPDEAYHPISPEDLSHAVSQSLRNHYGTYVPPRASGGFAVRVGSAGMIITPLEEGAISLVAFLVRGMRAPENAAPLLERLNDELFVRFHISGTSILATCDIPALPFVPRHLFTILNSMGQIVDRVDGELAEATAGSTLFEDLAGRSQPDDRAADGVETGEDDAEGAGEELPEELLALIHLENEESLDLDPAVIADLFRWDTAFILKCIRLAEEQMISWSTPEDDEEDPEETAARLHEADAWESTMSTLRRALHEIVKTAAPAPGDEGASVDNGGPLDEASSLEYTDHLRAWAHSLEEEIDSLEPGETLFVTMDAAPGEPKPTLSISRYLDTGVLARIVWDVRVNHPAAVLADLNSLGWHQTPSSGSTGPDRLVLHADTSTPELALACLSGLIATGTVGSLDDLSCNRASQTGDWRRLPPYIRVDVSSFDELRSTTTVMLEALGAHPALLPGIRLESPAANHSVTVEVSTQAPVLRVAGPVVAGADPDLVKSATELLPDTGFNWVYDEEQVVITAELDSSPFQPGHLEIILAAAEDVILVHSRELATEVGGRSAIEDYLAENQL